MLTGAEVRDATLGAYAPGYVFPREVEIQAEQLERQEEVVIRIGEGSGALRLIVGALARSLESNCLVRIDGRDCLMDSFIKEAGGAWLARGLPPGPHKIQFYRWSGTWQRFATAVELKPGEVTDVQIQLE